MKREELKAIVQNGYTQEKWVKTLQFLSGNKNLLNIFLEPKLIELKSAKAKEIVSDIVQLGSLKTTDGITLPIFDVTLQDGIKIEYNRVGVNDLLKNHILKDALKGAIVTFHYGESYNKTEWRFSFISKFGSDYFAEAESVETNPKKYTYIFGTTEEHRTALERLYNLEQSRFRLEDFFEAFNVEPVSNNFFKEYKNFYQDFVDEISNNNNSRAIFEKEGISKDDLEKDIRNFVKRLLGRLVFLYFLQKKHWLGATNKNYIDGDTNFLYNLFNYDQDSKDHFYKKWLSKLFFNALNTPNRNNDGFELPNGTNVCIPFLNGGLFEEGQEPEKHRDIYFPPTLFDLLFKFFNGYNFTIYENSPEDHTVAVDPEMLGHIFENLLEDNKDKGAFYTPKEIVHYMTQESLIEYLKTHLSHSREAIENLIKNHNTSDFTRDDIKKVEALIDTVKICDPAIGSGAFPMGLLQEIFALKAVIHFELGYTIWSPAKIKQNIIQNSIYGVDLEEGAVDIARLRFWLSLVVDEPTPKPLPNLDYKIMQGNSLLENYNGVDLSNVELFNNPTEQHITLFEEPKENYGFADDIKQLMDDYFNPKNYELKQQIHKKIDKKVTDFIDKCLEGYENRLLIELAGAKQTFKRKKELKQKTDVIEKEVERIENQLANKSEARSKLVEFELKQERPYFLWHLYFAEVFDNGGFDIVIGNPPYIQMKWLNDKLSIENSNFETFSKTGDVYCVFYELANIILKEKGNAVYITSNKWLRAEYGKSLREYFIKKTNPLKLIDFKGYKVFETATVDTNIILWKKEKYKSQTETLSIENDFNKNISLSYYFKKNSKLINFDFNNQWIVLNSNELRIKELVEKNKRLSELNFDLNYGILTGANPVFIINSKTYNDLMSKDENNSNIIKPILRGKDLIRYGFEFNQFYLINSHTGIKDKNILPIDIPNNYPTIEKYFNEFGADFKNRGEQGLNWYNLRSCTYMDYFEQPKIIYADIVQDRGKFYYDKEKFYTNDTAFIISGKDVKPLTAILNSSIVSYLYKTFYSGGGLGDKGLRFKKEFLGKVPIPANFNEENMSFFVDILQYLKKSKTTPINNNVKNDQISNFFEEVVDGCVFELYFEEHMKEKGINIIDDVKSAIVKSGLNQDFENIEEDFKKQKIWELYKTLKESTVNDRMRQFVAKSPDILKPIIQA